MDNWKQSAQKSAGIQLLLDVRPRLVLVPVPSSPTPTPTPTLHFPTIEYPRGLMMDGRTIDLASFLGTYLARPSVTMKRCVGGDRDS